MQEQAVEILFEAIEPYRRQCEESFRKLLGAPAFDFDENLRARLPEKPGLYVIRTKEMPTEFLHAGGTRARASLKARVWGDHFTGNGESDLIVKVINNGRARGADEAKVWIRSNCVVQWLVVEEEGFVCWAEHYMLGIVRPIWGA